MAEDERPPKYPSPAHGSDPAGDRERDQLAHLTRRLAVQYPDLDSGIIAGIVDTHYRRFADSTVRDFVLVLVERQARAELHHRST